MSAIVMRKVERLGLTILDLENRVHLFLAVSSSKAAPRNRDSVRSQWVRMYRQRVEMPLLQTILG
jgi:hypothetical protein